MIPLVDVKAQYAPLIPELKERFAEVLESGRFIFGPEVEAFEREAAAYLGVPHAIGVANGTDALVLSLEAMGVGRGDEVICPAFTFYATAEAIARVGATPVFADIDPVTLNLDPAAVAAARHRADEGDRAGAPLRPARAARRARRARPAAARGRGPGVRRAGHRDDGRLLDVQLLPDEEPLRPRRRRARGMHRRRRSPTPFASSASTGRATSRPSSSSGRTRASTRSRPRRCASSSRTSRAGTARAARRPPATPSWGSPRRSSCRSTSRGTSTTCTSCARPSASGSPTALDEAGIASASYYVTPLHLQPAMAYLGYEPGLAARDGARGRREPRAADVGRDQRRPAGAGRRDGARSRRRRRLGRGDARAQPRHPALDLAGRRRRCARRGRLVARLESALRERGPSTTTGTSTGRSSSRRRAQAAGVRVLRLLQPLVALRLDARHVGRPCAASSSPRSPSSSSSRSSTSTASRSRAASGSSTCCSASRFVAGSRLLARTLIERPLPGRIVDARQGGDRRRRRRRRRSSSSRRCSAARRSATRRSGCSTTTRASGTCGCTASACSARSPISTRRARPSARRDPDRDPHCVGRAPRAHRRDRALARRSGEDAAEPLRARLRRPRPRAAAPAGRGRGRARPRADRGRHRGDLRTTSQARSCSSRAPAARSAPSSAARSRASARQARAARQRRARAVRDRARARPRARVPRRGRRGRATSRTSAKLRQVFDKYRPGVVFHAAAYKHVALMEANPIEAVRNNTLGTRVVADVAVEFGAKRFVLVSTDKAANPKTVMGQSKALAEWIVETWGHRADVATRFVAVRFGNVLGSSGSVIPIFRRQIARGGPVTVTHPEMTRFFMTIPEAVQLIVQAGAIGGRGQVYVLDMGEPVRIVDLADKMIRLSGKEPGTDIAIEFIGPAPGREAARGARRRRRDRHAEPASEDRPDHAARRSIPTGSRRSSRSSSGSSPTARRSSSSARCVASSTSRSAPGRPRPVRSRWRHRCSSWATSTAIATPWSRSCATPGCVDAARAVGRRRRRPVARRRPRRPRARRHRRDRPRPASRAGERRRRPLPARQPRGASARRPPLRRRGDLVPGDDVSRRLAAERRRRARTSARSRPSTSNG